MPGSSRRVGRYRVLHEIGRGSMGVVYLGHDDFADLPVAIKFAHPQARGERGDLFRSLFFNETRAAGMLRHPNIVRLLDAGNEGDTWYIALEYVNGAATLDVWGARCAPLAPRAVAEVALKCAEALDYAHRKGVIHRDIKPGNVLIAADGAVKLTDFSVALLQDPASADTELMVSAGTPLYMSPEQVREAGLTGQTDLFSLGVVMYEMLTGEHPFAARTVAGATQRILHERPPPVDRLRGDVPPGLARIVARAMAKDCARRYASAWDLAADLSQVFGELEQPRDGINIESRVQMLKSVNFLAAFPDAEIWELLRFAEWLELDAGVPIVKEGDEGDLLFVVIQGQVSVHKHAALVGALGAGECFGEMAWLTRSRRSATVRSEGCVVLALRVQAIERASERCQVQFQKVFIRALAARLAETTEALSQLR